MEKLKANSMQHGAKKMMVGKQVDFMRYGPCPMLGVGGNLCGY